MLTKDGRDLPIEQLTPENYVVPKGEEKDYHAVIEVVQFDPKTGRRISRPRLQKFGRKTFEQNVRESLRKQGYTVTVLHNPSEWMKEQAAKREAAEKEAAEAAKIAEQKRFDEAVAAAVARALAEREAAEKEAAATEAKKAGRPKKSENTAPGDSAGNE